MPAKRKITNTKIPAKTPAKPYEPTPREREAVAKARKTRAIAPRLKSEMKDGKAKVSFDHPDQLYGMALLMDAIGVSDSAIFEGLISQLGNPENPEIRYPDAENRRAEANSTPSDQMPRVSTQPRPRMDIGLPGVS